MLTGAGDLSAGAAERIRSLLSARHDDFDLRCADLFLALGGDTGQTATPEEREARFAALDDDRLDFALAVAKPWYVGHVGTPSSGVLDDNAEFATFLEAQGSAKILDVVPRTSYPQNSAGWWSQPPAGVKAPDMPEGVTDGWGFQPDGPDAIRAPSPAWRRYAEARHTSLQDARAARPTNPAQSVNP